MLKIYFEMLSVLKDQLWCMIFYTFISAHFFSSYITSAFFSCAIVSFSLCNYIQH